MSKLKLSLGCWNYHHTHGLMEGRVQPDGINLNYLNMPVVETLSRMLRHQQLDVAKMSLSSYTLALSRPHSTFVAIPIYLSRFFRHSCIYVNADAGIRQPMDLIGKRVGRPEYQMTAPVWIGGIFSDHCSVSVDNVTYFTSGEEEPGRSEKIKLDLPGNIRVKPNGPTQTLSQILLDAELDALNTARIASSFPKEGGHIRHLLKNFVDVDRQYFRHTGTFLIMHTVAIRSKVDRANRWLAQSLYKVFSKATRRAYADFRATTALKTMLPSLTAHLDAARNQIGDDVWPYGLDRNRKAFDTLLRYHFEQALSRLLLTPDEHFAPTSLESFKI